MQHTVEQLCEAIEKHQLMPSKDFAAMRARWFRANRKEVADAAQFCRWLVINHYLTEFVVAVLQSGKADQLGLNQYKLRDQLKTGPMAGGFLATDPLQRPVVVEVLAASSAQDPAALMSFQRAAEQAMKVQHPNVGRTLEVGQAHGLHYLVKEFYEGETLATILERRGKLPYLHAARLFTLAFAGLQALHENGVPAGDLTPACLLLTAAGKGAAGHRTVKILHAGVKRRLFDESAFSADGAQQMIPDDLKLAGSVMLQPPAAAATPKPEVDIFRLGCGFYQSLTGKPPYAPEDLPEPKRPAAPISQLAPDVPEMLAQIVEEMIQPVASKRPQKPANVAKSLRVFLAAEEEAREAKAWVNVVPPESPAEKADEEREVEEEEPEEAAEERPAQQSRRAEAEGEQAPNKLAELWEGIAPKERDVVFLAIGALAVVLSVGLLSLMTSIRFPYLIALFTGGALTFFVERFVRWWERPSG